MGLGGWAGLVGVPTGVPEVRQTVGVAEVVLEAVTEGAEEVLMSKLAAAAVAVAQKQGQYRGRAAGCSPANKSMTGLHQHHLLIGQTIET